MSMVSKGIAAFKASKTNTSGRIPGPQQPGPYTTADFATSPAPENIGKEPALQGETTLDATLKNIGDAYPFTPPKGE